MISVTTTSTPYVVSISRPRTRSLDAEAKSNRWRLSIPHFEESSKATHRDEMKRRLPGWTQRPISLLTAMVVPAQKRWFAWNPTRIVIAIYLQLAISTSVAMLMALDWRSLLFILVPWVFQVGAIRGGMTTLMHYAVHQHPKERKPASFLWFAAEALSVVAMVQNLRAYRDDHLAHHGRDFATPSDPDLQLLLHLGFRPGMDREELWRNFWRVLVSPKFHRRMLLSRMRSNFLTARPLRRLAAVLWWTTVIVLVAWSGVWIQFFLAWIIATIILVNCAALAQFASEHRWLLRWRSTDPRAPILHVLTSARVCTDPLPSTTLKGRRRVSAWLVWLVRLVFLHVPARVAILPFDLVHHDMHHAQADVKIAREVKEGWVNWSNMLYLRPIYLKKCREKGWTLLTEIWGGLPAALDATFQVLSQLPPDLVEPEQRRPKDYDLAGM